jgi:hypothetical protein
MAHSNGVGSIFSFDPLNVDFFRFLLTSCTYLPFALFLTTEATSCVHTPSRPPSFSPLLSLSLVRLLTLALAFSHSRIRILSNRRLYSLDLLVAPPSRS